MARTMSLPMRRVALQDRLRGQFHPEMRLLLRSLPERTRERIEADVLVAAANTDYARLGSLQIVECDATGWCGLACRLPGYEMAGAA